MKLKHIPAWIAASALANWPVIIVVALVLPIAAIILVYLVDWRGRVVIPPGAQVTLPAVATAVPPTDHGIAAAPVFALAAAPTPFRSLFLERLPDGRVSLFVPAFTIVDACLDVNQWFTYQKG